MIIGNLKFAIPLGFVWTVLLLTLLPDLINLAGFDFGKLPWQWKSFSYSTLEYASVVTAFLIVIISFIDFRIKGDVSTPLVASTMFFSGALDFLHIMATEGLILLSADPAREVFPHPVDLSPSVCPRAQAHRVPSRCDTVL